MKEISITKALIICAGGLIAYSYMGPLGLILVAAVLMFMG